MPDTATIPPDPVITAATETKARAEAEAAAANAKKAAIEAENAAQRALNPVIAMADQEKARAEAEAAVANAQKAAIDAKNAAQRAANPAIAAADQEKAQADAKTAAANAKKAGVEADQAAVRAAIGAFPDSGYTGKVEIKTDGGKTEATIFAARAAQDAASRIASEIADKVERKTISVCAGVNRPTATHLRIFNLKKALLENLAKVSEKLDQEAVDALKDAKIVISELIKIKAEAAPVAGIALGLEALVKVAGLFKSDYEVGGYTISADDDLFGAAMAGVLKLKNPNNHIYLDSRPTPISDATAFSSLLDPVARENAQGRERAPILKSKGDDAKTIAAAETDPAKKALFEAAANACAEAATSWQALTTAYDVFISSLSTADDKGGYFIAKVIEEHRLANALPSDNQAILFVRLAAAVGGYYVKKNLWSFIGGTPFYVTAGIVATYTLISGTTGEVEASGVVPVYGGYVRADHVGDNLQHAETDVKIARLEQRITELTAIVKGLARHPDPESEERLR